MWIKHFEVIQTVTEEKWPDEPATAIRNIIPKTAEKHVPMKKRQNLQRISKETLKMIVDRMVMKKNNEKRDTYHGSYREKR